MRSNDEISKEWDDFCVAQINKPVEVVVNNIVKRLKIDPKDVDDNKDLLTDTAESLGDGSLYSEQKVLRRLGIEYGPLSKEQRVELRQKVIEEMSNMFSLCENGDGEKERPLPLVALVGFGSHFDVRMGLSETSDLDLMVIPLTEQEDGTQACRRLDARYTGSTFNGVTIARTDTHSDWLTGAWLKEHAENARRLQHAAQFKYVKSGSVVFIRNEQWAKLLDSFVHFEEKGIEVHTLGIE